MLGWELPPDNTGGLGVACYQLCKSLAKNNMDIDFVLPFKSRHIYEFMNVYPNDSEFSEIVYESGSEQKIISAYNSSEYSETDGWSNSQIYTGRASQYETLVTAMAKSRPYEVIHAHDWMTFRAALRAKRLANCPLIVHVHSIERDRSAGLPGNPMVREIEATTFLLADRVVAVSERTRQMISEDYNIPLTKIDVVHNSLDLSDVVELDNDNSYFYLSEMKKRGWKVVANVGRQTSQKGLPNFMHTAQAVVHKQPKTIFLFVGNGEQETELIELAAGLGISRNVMFAGFQRGKPWRDAYAIADLFVMPSVSEPFGLTPYEAIGYGTPSLVSKQSGISEVLVNCLKVDFWDIDEMANQIIATLRYDSLRDELHTNSLKEYLRLGWDGAADQLINIYNHHLAEAKP
ncbi:glycosyltransferase family 4 protein [Candidatus Saccharibacteria bacterium]|nr:glycosyltransferase family 4 protein [Candidatus Saccharibacteria bacterium]